MAQSSGGIGRFLKGIWRLVDTARRLFFNIVFIAIAVLVVVALLHDGTPRMPASGALVVAPAGVLVDQRTYVDPLTGLVGGGSLGAETVLSELVRTIDTAAFDDRIRLIVLQLDAMEHAGLSKLQELAQALQRFRQQGKQVIAVGDSYSQDQYWLAAHADQVFLNPMGAVQLQGYGVFTHYFKEALDRLAVRLHVFRVGTYKSAVEPFLRNDMSAAAARNNLRWLNALWDQYKAGVAAQRGITATQLGDYAANIDRHLAAHGGDQAELALAWGLVDELKTRQEMNAWLVGEVGADADGLFASVHHEDYLAATEGLLERVALPQVGVIVASGMILDGEQQPGQIGGDTLAQTIRAARADDDIRAVVLRIDSEGGSAFASEIIRQELVALKAAGKPLVVSMGSVAASGGYWIAVNADHILATPATLTGSIGIFGILPSFEQTLQRLGIHTDGVGTTPMAGATRLDRALPAPAARAIQSAIDHGYDRFVTLVASGRDLPVERVEAVAEGQIWAGSEAVELGLADTHGTLTDAIALAGRLAHLEQFRSIVVEPPISPRDLLFKELFGAAASALQRNTAWWPAALFSGAAPTVQLLGALGVPQLRAWNDPMGAYTYCLSCARP